MAEELPSSIKELKALILKAGLSTDGCIEKSDLRARALEAKKRLEQAENLKSQTSGASSAGPEVTKFSVYDSKIIHTAGGNKRDAVMIILHGYGATNDDFVPLCDIFKRHPGLSDKNITCIFPQAPPSKMGATAWWEIDVMKWMGAMNGGEAAMANLIRETPEGLEECRQNLIKLVTDVKEKFGDTPLILGGFSQGAMTSMDLALSLPAEIKNSVQSVVMLSGAPIVVEEWAEKLAEKKMKVFVSHGTADPVLPFMGSTWLKELLTKGGADVQYEMHSGGHELGPQHVIDALCSFLVDSLSKS